MKVKTVVLSGGPVAGKSMLLRGLKPELENLGYNVITVSEVAGSLIENGINVNVMNMTSFEELQLKKQFDDEETALVAAAFIENNKDTVILLDRGALDVLPYVGESAEQVFENVGVPLESAYKRYDLVIHLHTIADRVPFFSGNGVIQRSLCERTLFVNDWDTFHENTSEISNTRRMIASEAKEKDEMLLEFNERAKNMVEIDDTDFGYRKEKVLHLIQTLFEEEKMTDKKAMLNDLIQVLLLCKPCPNCGSEKVEIMTRNAKSGKVMCANCGKIYTVKKDEEKNDGED